MEREGSLLEEEETLCVEVQEPLFLEEGEALSRKREKHLYKFFFEKGRWLFL